MCAYTMLGIEPEWRSDVGFGVRDLGFVPPSEVHGVTLCNSLSHSQPTSQSCGWGQKREEKKAGALWMLPGASEGKVERNHKQ